MTTVREGKYFKLLKDTYYSSWKKDMIVKLNEDDGVNYPSFMNAAGETLFIPMGSLEEIEFTPGTICQVMKDVSSGVIKVGAYVKIVRDFVDGIFQCQDLSKDKHYDGLWCVAWSSLKKVEGISKAELSYGQPYISLKDSYAAPAGSIMYLEKDDGTDCPFFTVGKERGIAKYLKQIGKYEVPGEIVVKEEPGETITEAITAEKARIKESKAKLAKLTKEQDLQELQSLIDYLEPRKYSNISKKIFNRLKELKGLKERK